MYPAAFEYHSPTTIKDALGLMGKHGDDAKLLAGGHSLIPMMKLRLAQPKHLIDLRNVPGLKGVKEDDWFQGLMSTAVKEDEILVEIRVPALAKGVGAAYLKFPHPASRFAIVGCAAVVTTDGKGTCSKASIGITGAGTKAVR